MRTYYYETPKWAVSVLCFAAFLISGLCFVAFFRWGNWAGNAPAVIKWLLFLLGLAFLAAGIRPRNWKPWRYYYADGDGIHFPSECPQTRDTDWLLVPWARIGNITRQRFLSRYQGPAIVLRLSDDEIDRFFAANKLTKRFFRQPDREGGFFTVGYSNAFKNIDHAIRTLNQLKAQNT